MQLGIVNEEAAALAGGAELEVIMNRCMKTEFARLFGGLDWICVDAKAIMNNVKLFLVTLFLLGISENGYSHEEVVSLPANSLTDEYYQAFRGFYYDSYQTSFEVMGNEIMALALEDFSKLPLESQYSICLVGMDYVVFSNVVQGGLIKILKGRPLGSLVLMLFSDLIGISWDFKRELSKDEKIKFFGRMIFLKMNLN